MEPWIRAHLETEHPWDYELWIEAMTGFIREDIEEMCRRLRLQIFIGDILATPPRFKGISEFVA